MYKSIHAAKKVMAAILTIIMIITLVPGTLSPKVQMCSPQRIES